MANIIPMAGLGSRFSEEGYTIPKPLIPVSGTPMIIQVIRSLPSSNKWIFLVRQEQINGYEIDKIIQSEIPDAIIIAVNKTTLGQANTSLLSQAYLNPDEPVLIAACDNISIYNKESLHNLISSNADCIVFTFTKMNKLKNYPNSYGWVELDQDNKTITNVSVKKTISDKPYFDNAITGTFFFKRAKDFIESTNLMINEGHKTNNEFYLDSVPIFTKKIRKNAVIFSVDQYISWDTPTNLKEYEKWESFFINNKHLNFEREKNDEFLFWQKYFNRGIKI
jgi:NDP-sugar pyrophosphorylase family protein